jgi:preprotein translocase subunit SecY
MNEDTKVLRDYLLFTVPHVTVLAGALLGVLLLLGVKLNVALGIFTIFYGFMLLILALVIRGHFSKLLSSKPSFFQILSD